MRFRQHIPGFVDIDPFEFEYSSTQELIENPEIVKRYKDKDFYKWSWSSNDGKWSKACLMVETEEGRHWWVVGYLSDIPELPEWHAPESSKTKQQEALEKKEYQDWKQKNKHSTFFQVADQMVGDGFAKIRSEIFAYRKKNTKTGIKRS